MTYPNCLSCPTQWHSIYKNMKQRKAENTHTTLKRLVSENSCYFCLKPHSTFHCLKQIIVSALIGTYIYERTTVICQFSPVVSSGNTWPHESRKLYFISAICPSLSSVNRPLHTAWHVAPWPCLPVITGAVSWPSQGKRDRGTQQRKPCNKA